MSSLSWQSNRCLNVGKLILQQRLDGLCLDPVTLTFNWASMRPWKCTRKVLINVATVSGAVIWPSSACAINRRGDPAGSGSRGRVVCR